LSRAYLRQRRLRRGLARAPGGAAGDIARRPADPLPAGILSCLIASNEHGAYCLPQASQHRPVAEAILQSRVWEADTLNLLCAADLDGDIVHAGTFFGDFLPALARSRSNGALVWGFEPAGENFRCAQITTQLNDLHNVVLTHAALGSESGSALLQTVDKQGVPLGGASRLLVEPLSARGRAREEVEVVTVDRVVGSERRVAVLQLDVEGHEQHALSGAKRTIERCRPLLVLETLPEAAWVAQELTPLGYEPDGSVDRNIVLRCRR
jgi:FkbM family methyltransferase